MDKITIFNDKKTSSVVMPRIKNIQVGAKEESKSITMASGKIVKDMLGHRATLTATWDYVPADTITKLLTLLRNSAFVWVEYPSPTGKSSGFFDAEYPTLTVFQYKNGQAVWHDVTLTMTAQEVK